MRGANSAPTERVLDVIELLSESRDRPLRFSDVARELNLSQATAHAILKTLTARGWVSRDPTSKEFALGPALAVIAHRLATTRPLAATARDAIDRLVKSTGMPASVVERNGDELVITAFANPDGSAGRNLPRERIPYAPPFGIACAAWDTPDEQESWVRRGAAGDAQLVERLHGVLAETRARGYDVDWMTPALAQAAHALGTLTGETVPQNLRAVVDQLRVEFISANPLSDDNSLGAHPVATISAPVLDDSGRVRLILGIHPLRTMTIDEIRSAAEPLLGEIAGISSQTVLEACS
ncbi:transcriptional regulator [Mycolicibacterium moriokaense]|uniref:Glycerol operon regulatory protein n=1 Tax=Mycolicibacterium moriokaense TaxID=39691 RepID=A0AAD1HGB3_9MYCO|nr:helix-turn-helix domain-containing protein [Mycolicibacterium moriokaense]MCV7039221.1 helix-turn-helix domain-containing protein [Mycolicibacterium moriokaense]ORB26926.1 transcriptional regulator [Mycolicibacterium moriokaense]BBX03741.1 putative transcriptional regulator, IclR family protein [Mycolicibacterium moriokaense]